MSAPLLELDAASIRTAPSAFFDGLRAKLTAGARVVTFYGRPDADPERVTVTAVVEADGRLEALRTALVRAEGYHALTRDFPALHIFERELFEAQGITPHDHPWLKPVRFSGGRQGRIGEYPFFRIDGKEVHEVAVGPIHAGVIEPGHFRFSCLGEVVHHLEIHHGFQHRGVEALLLSRSPWALTPLVETIAGDSSVAYAWAYCRALEALAGIEVPEAIELSRGIALELERVAMHLSSLSGMCGDIGFLQGSATYGRLRTTAINTSMLLCGSRFGRGWLRPGGSRAAMSEAQAGDVRKNLALIRNDLAIIDDRFLASKTVRHRLEGVGVLTHAQALALGVVGMVARSSGVALDARSRLGGQPWSKAAPELMVETAGDCQARAALRIRELDASLRWLDGALDAMTHFEPVRLERRPLADGRLAVSICEGFRGEVVHCVETGAGGELIHYRSQDPSLRNWFGAALAVRNNAISDFPSCNKSFDLSYCGNDL